MENCHKTQVWKIDIQLKYGKLTYTSSMENWHKTQEWKIVIKLEVWIIVIKLKVWKIFLLADLFSILQDELFLFYYYCTRVFKFFSYCSERKCSYGNGILFKIRCRLGNTNAIFRKSWKRRICWNIWKGLYKSVTIYTLWRLIYTFLPI